jgi:hypothetical protein
MHASNSEPAAAEFISIECSRSSEVKQKQAQKVLDRYILPDAQKEAHSKGMSNRREIWHYARQKEAALHGA